MRSKTTRIIAALAILAAAALSVTVAAGARSDAEDSRPSPPAVDANTDQVPPPLDAREDEIAAYKRRIVAQAEGREATSAVTRDQAQLIGALARDRQAGDDVPDSVRQGLGRTRELKRNRAGFNIDLARRVRTPGGSDAWIVPGRDQICLITTDPAGERFGFSIDCEGLAQTTRGELSAEWVTGDDPAEGKSTIIGVVPDGVAEVTIQERNGSPRAIPVQSNAYLVEGGRPTAVTFNGADGRQGARL